MKKINLSKLRWIKVIRDLDKWAYTPAHLSKMSHYVLDQNGVTIFPLGFRREPAKNIEAEDEMALIQNGKLTHIVQILDNDYYSGGDWFHRLVKVIWWKPDLKNWEEILPQSDFLGFDPALQDGDPHEIINLKRFREKWDSSGGLEGFQNYIAEKLYNS
ncbi:hypothetical protein K9N68_12530 [Kovacikia minuta CCNUW1]|uniref:hypothetical protein n=1 Tax=Kovacikia minuta TaxID=2931930 RepID=UPI001CCB23AB|nr:hypothetical protein [Kovacikia minuta]UBF28626.1 hypothetical protein K9N68_12530 [Kovacikia minuta CCNUW1]